MAHDEKGFRLVWCPLCRREVSVTSWPDDTRSRYSSHHVRLATGDSWTLPDLCPSSDELIPKPTTPKDSR